MGLFGKIKAVPGSVIHAATGVAHLPSQVSEYNRQYGANVNMTRDRNRGGSSGDAYTEERKRTGRKPYRFTSSK